MSISDAQYSAWLSEDGADRVVLVELVHSAGTEYVASRPFISEPTDTPANQIYGDILATAIDLESRMDDMTAIGDVSVVNDGSLAAWIGYNWRGHSIKCYLGAQDWSRDDFRLIVDAINGGMIAVESDRIKFDVLSAEHVLDEPLQADYLSDGYPIPVCFGEAFNVRPALYDTANHGYQVNDGAVTSVAARDNGADLTETTDLSNGKFTLASRPLGEVGVDVVESNDTVKEVVQWVCNAAGLTANTTLLDALPTYKIGLYYDTPDATLADVMNDACNSIGAFWRIGATGEVEVYQIDEPAVTEDYTIVADDIIERGFRLVRIINPIATLTLNYKRNWNTHNRDSLAGIVATDEDLAEDLSTEWRRVTSANTVTDYPLAEDQVLDTFLVSSTDAQTEADRIAGLYDAPRKIWEVEAFLTPAEALVGDTVKITNPRHGFDGGVNCLVLARRHSPTRGRVTLEVMQ